MCGIVAACRQDDVVPFLFQAIKRMEYRGYDSCGMAYKSHNGNWINTARAVGGWDNPPRGSGWSGIGHTRWATHGEVSICNTHPIRGGQYYDDPTFFIVHNGNITNYDELRNILGAEGYCFRTETDTEVIAHLFDHLFEEKSGYHDPLNSTQFVELIRKVCQQLQGQFAIAVISTKFPGFIGAASFGAPLLCSSQGYIASDAKALAGYADTAYRLNHGDMLVMSNFGVDLFDDDYFYSLDERKKVQIPCLEESQHNYQHQMLKEIHEQANLEIQPLQRHFPIPSRIMLFGCGSSYNAARLGRFFIEDLTGIPCEVEYAADLHYRNADFPEDTLFVALTQSGETKDTLLAMENLHNHNIVVITNDMTSTAASYADWVIPLEAGDEIGVAATKTFTMQVVRLIQLGISCVPEWFSEDLMCDLGSLCEEIERVLGQEKEIKEMAEVVSGYERLIFLGRGRSYPIAKEAALKMKEVSYIFSEAIHAAEMKHGPLALIDEDVMAILIDSHEECQQERVLLNAKEIQARGGNLLVLTGAESPLAKIADYVIPINSSLLIQPLLANVALQLLAYYVAVEKGLNPDRPRSLAKAVTVE